MIFQPTKPPSQGKSDNLLCHLWKKISLRITTITLSHFLQVLHLRQLKLIRTYQLHFVRSQHSHSYITFPETNYINDLNRKPCAYSLDIMINHIWFKRQRNCGSLAYWRAGLQGSDNLDKGTKTKWEVCWIKEKYFGRKTKQASRIHSFSVQPSTNFG